MYILNELIVVSYLRGGYGLILPYMGMDCQFISLYGEFVTSLSANYSRENINKCCVVRTKLYVYNQLIKSNIIIIYGIMIIL